MSFDTINFSLAIAATVLSLLAIGTTIAFFVIQTRQAREMEKDNLRFVQDMHATLSELKGITRSTQGTVQQHQNMLLKAVLEQRGISIKQETSPLLTQLSNRIESIENTVGVQNRNEIGQMKKELLTLKAKIEEASLPEAFPELPHLFYGSATYFGSSTSHDAPAQSGSSIAALIGDEVVAKTVYNGLRYSLVVAAPDGKSYKNKEIRFISGGLLSVEKTMFVPGEISNMNLTFIPLT